MPVADGAPKRARTAMEFDWVQATARHVGVVAHRVFAQIAREGVAAWNRERVEALRKRLAVELAGEGVDGAGMSAAMDAVVASVLGVIGEARGRWLFAPEHLDATSEWALSGIEEGSVARIVIDRSFVADGVRWIVDFKTSLHEGSALDAFLDREVERYRDQLARYARFVRALDPRPIRLGLYYPRFAGWRVWENAG
jgi:ATP-dependent exoDNAse (exonuclease V) beta subunit